MSLLHKGYYGMSLPNATIINSLKPQIKGFFIRNVNWSALQTSSSNFNWPVLDNLVSICVQANIDFVFSIPTGPDCPLWLFNMGVPKVTTQGANAGEPTTYPFYLNSIYRSYLKGLTDAIAAHIASWPADWKARLAGWQSAESWVNRYAPYTGTPTNSAYIITNAQWDDFLKTTRAYMYQANTTTVSIFNPGDDGRLYDWQRANCPNSAMHAFSIGRLFGQTAELSFFHRTNPPPFYRAELESTPSLPDWNQQVFGALIASCLDAGIGIFSVNTPTVYLPLMDFFNAHVDNPNSGFIYMRRQIDMADTNLYSVGVYGPVINPAQAGAYASYISSINSLYSASPNYLEYLTEAAASTYFNPARATAIRNANSPKGARWQPGDLYYHDYGIYLESGCYEKGIGLINAELMTAAWRKGPTTGIDGRFVLGFPAGVNEFFVNKRPALTLMPNMLIKITYLDEGTGCWAPTWSTGGAAVIQPFVNLTNTGKYITKSYSVAGLVNNGVQGMYLLSIKRCGVSNVWFSRIEVLPVKNPPVANAGADQTITQPANSAVLDASLSSDPDGPLVGFFWSQAGILPSIATIVQPPLVSTSVINLSQVGVYSFIVDVMDSDLNHATDIVNVTVSPGKPIADAGGNQTIALPTNSVTLDASNSLAVSGTITGYAWSKTVGGAAAIANPTQKSTLVTGLVAGDYTFRVQVTNSYGLTAIDTVNVHVDPIVNQPPIADAGNNQTITVPASSVTLSASASVAGSGSITAYFWTQISGAAAAIVTNNAVSTSVTGLAVGDYTFQVQVTNSVGLSDTDTVDVSVLPAPEPPIADAGNNQTITLPTNTVTLTSAASTPGAGETITNRLWSKVSGPAATIVTQTGITTAITGMVAGTYIFQVLITNNNNLTDTDTVQVVVNAVVVNNPPVADAGNNQTITLPTNFVTLNSSASYDPDGTIVSRQWSKVSGGVAAIASANAISTNVTGMVAGTYIFQIRVTDNGGLSSTDPVTITVNPVVNQPPVANAGPNQTVLQPPTTQVSLTASASTDDVGIVSYHWTQTSGPTANILSPNAVNTDVSGLIVGVFIFRVRVVDGGGLADSASVTITVNAASNQPPVAVASPANQTIIYPGATSATISSSNSHDDDGTIVAWLWTKLSGPAVTITSYTAITTTVTGLTPGVYIFNIRVTDNLGAFGNDTCTVTVTQTVTPPTANAGGLVTVTSPDTTATIGGNDIPGSNPIVTTNWVNTSKPQGAVVGITLQHQAITGVTGIGPVGDYTFAKTVGDNSVPPLTDTASCIVRKQLVNSQTTNFGLILGDNNESVADKCNIVKQLFNCHYIRGARELLSTFSQGQGSQMYNQCKSLTQSGYLMKLVQNVNWTSPPNAVFATDQVDYKKRLNWMLDSYGKDNTVVEMIVIENEPDNLGYYPGNNALMMANYINELQWAIEVCHARTPPVKVADGCLHIISVMDLVNGGGSGSRAALIVQGIRNLADAGKPLDFVNLHTNVSANNGAANVRNFIAAASYLRAHTTIQTVMSNEFHIEDSNSGAMIQAIDDCVTAGLKYCMPFSGDYPWVSNKAYPLEMPSGNFYALTAMGTDVKNRFDFHS